MKQEYLILKDDDKNKLTIQESAELDKELFSILCENVYDSDIIKSVIEKGADCLLSDIIADLIAKLRNHNMYPPYPFAVKIAESIIDLYKSPEKNQSVKLLFDDIEFLGDEQEDSEPELAVEDEPAKIDKLLEDTFDEDHKNGKITDSVTEKKQ